MELRTLIGKQFKVVKEDPELITQFPKLVKGFKFQVVSDDKENRGCSDAITGVVCLKTGKFISIKDNPNSWFWCFWVNDSIDTELEEIGSGNHIASRNEIKLNHFGGRIVPLTFALSSFAAQENCDSEEYDTMQKAAEYITYLEGIVNERK
ncbi:protease inhibitor [Serratia phage X20]|uniref:Protease inhibitor n=1 Tax=Serratia phage X20 TaxID=2006942 RepID=A0A1Z1LZ04_9CAUD|nr:inhibitor of host Lon protease [Serratia phage X20]ARW58045.1 protease inhibitor [Serratia phage X20]